MWYVDASFAVHPNMRSHTGGGLTMGRGFPISVLTKQKLTVKSLTEGELVGVDDIMPIILWTRQFLLAQGYGIVENLLLQDNKSSILLERNGKASSGKRTRHINIRYFFITDWVDMKEVSIDWCLTKDMVAYTACGHLFEREAIDIAVKGSGKCPTCRASLGLADICGW
jgi:hypothetical protein